MRTLSTFSVLVLTLNIQDGETFQPATSNSGIRRILENPVSSNYRSIDTGTHHNTMPIPIRRAKHVLFQSTSTIGAPQNVSKETRNKGKRKTNNTGRAWKANYKVSSLTQKKIKSAAKMRASPIVRASAILKTFLNTDPKLCNPTNLVCALTLSAKIVPRNAQRRHEFRELLHEALDILSVLVKKNQLNTRQLANAAWAIAKHYSNDELILPPSFTKSSSMSYLQGDADADAGDGSTLVSLSEKWDLDEEKNKQKYQTEERVLETLENIAQQLMDTMEMMDEGEGVTSSSSSPNGRKQMNEVEMSMLCWAYAVIFPRNIPAGWELPPRSSQMEKMQFDTLQRTNDGSNIDIDRNKNENGNEETVTFETIQDSSTIIEEKEEDYVAISYVDRLFDTIAETIVREQSDGLSMIQTFRWKELSSITWSYANRGYCQSKSSLDLILHLADAATARIEKAAWVGGGDEILPRDLSEIAWALGVMQTDNYILSDPLEDFITALDNHIIGTGVQRPLRYWKSADCVQLAIALGHGRLDRQSLLTEIYSEALRSMNEVRKEVRGNEKIFQDFELVVLLWVQARLYLTSDICQVFDDFAEMVPGALLYRMHMADNASSATLDDTKLAFDRIRLGAQERANLAWSLTILEKFNSQDSIDILRCIFNVSSAACKDGDLIRLEHGHQLWQSLFILEEECPRAVDHVDNETFQFLKKMWYREKTRHKTSSARHRSLSDTLNFMGVKHYNEHDEDIDLALVLKTESKWTNAADLIDTEDCAQRVAVEFDGPSHFTKMLQVVPGEKPEPPRALGHTVLKYRLLKRQGWTIVRVPFYEYDRIPFWASMERQRYVQRKLKTHANLKFSGVDISEYKAPVPNRKSRFD